LVRTLDSPVTRLVLSTRSIILPTFRLRRMSAIH